MVAMKAERSQSTNITNCYFKRGGTSLEVSPPYPLFDNMNNAQISSFLGIPEHKVGSHHLSMSSFILPEVMFLIDCYPQTELGTSPTTDTDSSSIQGGEGKSEATNMNWCTKFKNESNMSAYLTRCSRDDSAQSLILTTAFSHHC